MRVFLAALCVAVFACLYSFPVRAQSVEMGNGLICDTSEQVALFASMLEEKGSQGALKAVNEDAKSETACVVGHTVAYVLADKIADVRIGGKLFFIAKIIVVGVETPAGMQQIQPAEFYSLFHGKDEGRPA